MKAQSPTGKGNHIRHGEVEHFELGKGIADIGKVGSIHTAFYGKCSHLRIGGYTAQISGGRDYGSNNGILNGTCNGCLHTFLIYQRHFQNSGIGKLYMFWRSKRNFGTVGNNHSVITKSRLGYVHLPNTVRTNRSTGLYIRPRTVIVSDGSCNGCIITGFQGSGKQQWDIQAGSSTI